MSILGSLGTLHLGMSQNEVAQHQIRFERAVRAILREISLLYKLLNTIRRASKESQNLKAAVSFKIKDLDGNDLEQAYRERYADNILDRFPGISEVLRNRLATSTILRRKRIPYRRSRYEKTPVEKVQNVVHPIIIHRQPQSQNRNATPPSPKAPVQSNEPVSQAKSSLSGLQSQTKSATTVTAEKFKSASSPSVVSVTNTVALTNHEGLVFPPVPQTHVKTISIQHTEGREGAALEVICPYCFCALSGLEVGDEKKWRFV